MGGLVVVVCSAAFLGTPDTPFLQGLPPARALIGLVKNPGTSLVSFLGMAVGAILCGASAMRAYPNRLGAQRLPTADLRRGRWRAILLALGLVTGIALWYRLANGAYSHADIALFLASLSLCSLAFHSGRRAGAQPINLTRIDVALLAAVAGVTAATASYELTNWLFAWRGDEYAFYNAATDIAVNGTWNFFDLTYVYNTHPTLDSLMQAISIRILGASVVSWRLAEVILLMMAAVTTALLALLTLGRAPALVAGTVVGTSHYAIALGRSGINNVHPLLFSTLALLALVLAWRTQRSSYVFLTGAASGLTLYTFLTAPLVLPIIGIEFVISSRHLSWRDKRATFAAAALGFVMVVTPALLVTRPSELMQVASTNSRREVALTDPWFVARSNIISSLSAFWTDQAHGLYVGSSLVDRASAAALAIGLGIALLSAGHVVSRVTLLWFFGGVILLGITFYIPQPPISRLVFVIPAVGLAAALATGVGEKLFGSGSFRQRMGFSVVCIAFCGALPFVNLQRLLVVSPQTTPSTTYILLMKQLQERAPARVVYVSPSYESHADVIVNSYPWLSGRFENVGNKDLTSARSRWPADTVVVVSPDSPPEFVSKIEKVLEPEFQKIEERDPSGAYRVWLFLPRGSGHG